MPENRHEYARRVASETPEERAAHEAQRRARYGFDSTPEDDTPEEADARRRFGEEEGRRMDQIVADDEAGDSVSDWFDPSDAQAAERMRTHNASDRLADEAPTVDQMTPEYDLLGDSAAGKAYADKEMIEAQRRALQQLEEWGRGEMTSADFGRRDIMRRELAGDERRQRAGVTRGFQERGLGGSGLEVMGQLSAQQGMADRLSAQDAALQVAVQDRALRSIEAAGGLAGQGRGQSFDEAMGRGNAIDRFNAMNNQTTNRQRDARAQAERDRYQHSENRTAMETGQYNREASQDAEDRARATAAAGEAVGGIVDWFGDDEED